MDGATSIEPGTRPGTVLALLALTVAAAGAASVAVLSGERVAAGAAVGSAGAALVVADRRAREARAPRLSFSSSLAERVADGAIFGSLAWRLMPGSGRAGGAALLALAASYGGTYLRAKAAGLGFALRERPLVQPLRLTAVTVGLLGGWVEAGLWAAAGVSVLSVALRAREVAGQGEPA